MNGELQKESSPGPLQWDGFHLLHCNNLHIFLFLSFSRAYLSYCLSHMFCTMIVMTRFHRITSDNVIKITTFHSKELFFVRALMSLFHTLVQSPTQSLHSTQHCSFKISSRGGRNKATLLLSMTLISWPLTFKKLFLDKLDILAYFAATMPRNLTTFLFQLALIFVLKKYVPLY